VNCIDTEAPGAEMRDGILSPKNNKNLFFVLSIDLKFV
jgi:hypothetical protein